MKNGVTLDLRDAEGEARRAHIHDLVIAGWTGRNQDAMEAHISELEAIGIARPKTTPIFYRVAANLLTTGESIQVPGNDSSGEVEVVVLSLQDGLFMTVGSDHTDRQIETIGITTSKQLCGKPIGREIWRFDEVSHHWDELVLRAYAITGDQRRLYQEGAAVSMRHPNDLMERYLGAGATLPTGWAMFCGTQPTIGEIGPADAFEIEIEDPVLGRKLNHGYVIEVLPVEG